MTEQNNDMQAQLAALLAMMQNQGATAAPAVGGWGKPAAPPAPAEVLGVSVPIKLDTPVGQIRLYLNFPASAASSPAALLALLESLSAAGIPLDTWQPKERESGGWGGGDQGNRSGGGWNDRDGGGNAGGWNNNRRGGGYGRGGYDRGNGYGGNRGGWGR